MKKILVDAYTELNLGDDLFLKVLKDRYPNVRFSLNTTRRKGIYKQFNRYCPLSYFERIFYKILFYVCRSKANKFLFSKIEKSRKRASEYFDGLLNIGGSLFMQKSPEISYAYRHNLKKFEIFKHSFIIGANFGPVITQDFLYIHVDSFKHCDSIVFRDTYSKKMFSNLKNVSCAPDVVFQLNPPEVKKIPDSVGISVIDLKFKNLSEYQNIYISFLMQLIEELLNSGKQVFLYSFCKKEGDETIVKEISKKIIHNNLRCVYYNKNIDDFLSKFGSMEAIFASRFHAMILAFVYKQKVLPFIYSKKMTQVLEDIDFSGQYIEITDLEKHEVHNVIDKLYTCDFVLPEYIKTQSELMFKDFDLFINS